MSDIFDEVDEGVRQDKMEAWWAANKIYVFALVALIIGAVALNEFVLKPSKEKAYAARAATFEAGMTALEDDDFEAATAAFQELASGKSKLAPIAASMLAEVKAESGDAEGATAELAAIGTVEGGPFERLALLKTAYAKVDGQSLTELEATLGSLVEDDGAIGALARELVAAKAWSSGDVARARTMFNRLRLDPAASTGVRRRAELALAAIPKAAPAAPEQTEETAEETEGSEESSE